MQADSWTGERKLDSKISRCALQRTLATLLQQTGASVKTTQELLRHASHLMTLGTYAKVVTSDKRRAQESVVDRILSKPVVKECSDEASKIIS